MAVRPVLIVAVVMAVSAAASCADRGPDATRTTSSASSAAPAPTPSFLAPEERWSPPTSADGDRVVMPVTFPDGTTAELVYPEPLELERLSVYPDTYAEGGPRECGVSVHATRYDPRLGWVTGDRPIAQHERDDGTVVEVREGTRDHAPYDFLVYRFGSWSVLVPCRWRADDIDAASLAAWADNLHGEESADGLLVLSGTDPIRMHPYQDRSGPTVRLSSEDAVIDLTVGPEACGWDVDDREVTGDGTVQWCIQPEGGIWLYATAFAADGRTLLEDVVAGLQIRNVRSS